MNTYLKLIIVTVFLIFSNSYVHADTNTSKLDQPLQLGNAIIKYPSDIRAVTNIRDYHGKWEFNIFVYGEKIYVMNVTNEQLDTLKEIIDILSSKVN